MKKMRLAIAFFISLALPLISGNYPDVPATVAQGAQWEEIYSAKKFFEGPTWDEAGQCLWFTAFGKEESDTSIMVWSAKDGKTQLWVDKTEGVNGTFLGPNGALLGAQAFGHRIVEYIPQSDGQPSKPKVWMEDSTLHQPNDLALAQDGTLYFSDPDFAGKKKGAIYRLVAGGRPEALPCDLVLPNGIEISADGKTLIVSDSDTKRWYEFDLACGKEVSEIKPARVFFDPQVDDSKVPEGGLPDGLCLDEKGNWYLTGRGGVWCVNPKGEALGFLALPEFVSNVCFGGEDGRTLFATGQGKVWRLRMNVKGHRLKPLNTWNHADEPRNPLLTHHVYRSESMKTDVGYTIWLPPGYENSTERYPVLFWLHGLGGTENGGKYPVETLAQLVKEVKMPPTILVQANGGAMSVYADSFDGRWMSETTIIRELIPHIDSTYRTRANREGRAIQGMSMGGEGSLRFALKYPELFSSVVAYAGGYVSPQVLQRYRPSIYREMFDAEKTRYERFRTQSYIRAGKHLPAIRVICGTKDESLNLSQEIHSLLEKAGIPHEYMEVPDAPHDIAPLIQRPSADDLIFAANHFTKPTR
jgi:gluconolactonase